MKLSDERALYAGLFGEEMLVDSCIEPAASKKEELEQVEDAIFTFQWMLDDAYDRDDHDEIVLMRRELQEAKCAKRRILAS